MKKDLFLCRDIREDFQRWLGCGVGPLTISQRGTAAVILNSLPKTEEIDYLYCAAAESGGVTWDNDLSFFGVYDHRNGSLYMTLSALRTSAVKDISLMRTGMKSRNSLINSLLCWSAKAAAAWMRQSVLPKVWKTTILSAWINLWTRSRRS